MRADDEACDLCGAAAGQPHRLRCTRVIDEQMEAHEFEDSAGVQLSLIGGVVSGIVAMVAMIGFGRSLFFAGASAVGVGGGVYEFLRRIAESRRDAAAKRRKEFPTLRRID